MLLATRVEKKWIKNDPDLFAVRTMGMNTVPHLRIVKPNPGYSEKGWTPVSVKHDNTNEPEFSANHWAKLVVAIAEKEDQDAFKCLFNYFAPRVKSFMIGAGLNDGAADEIAQETLLTVWRKAGQYNPALAAVSTWIFTIARNKKIDKFRKDSRPLPDVNDPSFSLEPEASPEQATWNAMSSDNIHVAMSSLPEDQRTVLFLAFIDDNPHQKISEILGIPLGTVKSRIRLGLSKMRTLLSDHRGDFS